MCMCEQWWVHCTRQWGVTSCWMSMCTVWVSHSKWASRAVNLHQILCSAWTFLHGNYLDDSEGCSYRQLVIGSFITTQHAHLCIKPCTVFLGNIKSPRWLSLPTPDMLPSNFWLFPKLKLPLKRKFQAINEIQENMMRQLMVIGRTVWGPKVPTLKNTEVSFFYVQCFLYVLQ